MLINNFETIYFYKMGFNKKNIEYTQRNGNGRESKTIIKYITQEGKNGIDGADAYQVILSPNNHAFAPDTDNQSDRVNVFVFRGTTPINSYIVESGIQGEIGKGSTNALTVTVHNNGTNQTYFDVNANSNLNSPSGTLVIPVQYNVDTFDSSIIYDASLWDSSVYTIETFEAIYSWTMAGQSAYVLDLSNENASINADASGNIIAGAIRPTCKAKLTYGTEDVSGVQYSISYPSNYGVQGVSINSSTGVITFNAGNASTPFRFGDLNDPNDTVLEITVDASFNNNMHREKVMTVTKSLPGQSGVPGDPGDDAVSRWIELSTDAIRVDSSNNVIPPTITATAWKQVGGNDPSTDSAATIKWAYDSSVTSNTYSSPITINGAKNYMTFKLYYGNQYLGESETVPILRDGKNGEPGAQGRKGAAVRGPWLWDSSNNVNKTGLSPRRFCSGDNTLSDSDADWIDIIIHDGTYYRCKTSYNSGANDVWSGSGGVSGKWQAADASYEFVAAHLLLANNAKINFLTNNELYLMDNSNHITGGAAGGTGISFWAGAEQPSDAPFQVNYDGNIRATSGTFSGYLQMPYVNVSSLNTNTSGEYIADNHAYLIAYPGTSSQQQRRLVLPDASSGLNGFMYDIIIYPRLTRMESHPDILIRTVSNKTIYCVAYAELRMSDKFNLNYGRYTITCVPYYELNQPYAWFITSATGGIEVVSSNSSEYVSTLIASSGSSYDVVYRVQTYTGSSAPSTPNQDNTIFIQK